MKKPTLYNFEFDQTLEKLPDTYLWKFMLLDSVVSPSNYSNDFGLDLYQSVMFVGPPGNGKHDLCAALESSIYEERQKGTVGDLHAVEVFVDSGCFSGISNEEYLVFLQDLYRRVSAYPLAFVVFEQIDSYEKLPLFFVDMEDILKEYDDSKDIFTFFLMEDYSLAHTTYLKNTLICRCNNPTSTMRKQYLDENMSWRCDGDGEIKSFSVCGDSFSVDDVVRETEGYSYWDLEQLVQCLKREAGCHAMNPKYAKDEAGCCKVTLNKEKFQMYLEAFRPSANTNDGSVIMTGIPVYHTEYQPNVYQMNQGGSYNRVAQLQERKPEELTAREQYELVMGFEV